MKWLIIHTILLAIVIGSFGCLDPFSFERTDQDVSIVVDGQLTTSDGPHYVRISNVLAFGDKYFDPVPGINVRLHDEDKTYQFVESSTGVHVIPQGILSGIPGKIYYISMTLPNGDILKSSPERMPENHALKEVNGKFIRENVIAASGIERPERIIELTINAEFPEIDQGAEFYLRYSVEEDFSYPEVRCGPLHAPKICYVNVPAFTKDFALFNSTLSGKTTIDSLVIHKKSRLSAVQFRGKHYFSVVQQSITKEAYEYWLRIKEVTNQEGTVFDKPPASVPGNIMNETNPEEHILGYFELAAIDVKRRGFIPSEYFAGSSESDECSPFNRRNWPRRCCECLELDDASTQRPSWF